MGPKISRPRNRVPSNAKQQPTGMEWAGCAAEQVAGDGDEDEDGVNPGVPGCTGNITHTPREPQQQNSRAAGWRR